MCGAIHRTCVAACGGGRWALASWSSGATCAADPQSTNPAKTSPSCGAHLRDLSAGADTEVRCCCELAK
jgi:hypothetical protein